MSLEVSRRRLAKFLPQLKVEQSHLVKVIAQVKRLYDDTHQKHFSYQGDEPYDQYFKKIGREMVAIFKLLRREKKFLKRFDTRAEHVAQKIHKRYHGNFSEVFEDELHVMKENYLLAEDKAEALLEHAQAQIKTLVHEKKYDAAKKLVTHIMSEIYPLLEEELKILTEEINVLHREYAAVGKMLSTAVVDKRKEEHLLEIIRHLEKVNGDVEQNPLNSTLAELKEGLFKLKQELGLHSGAQHAVHEAFVNTSLQKYVQRKEQSIVLILDKVLPNFNFKRYRELPPEKRANVHRIIAQVLRALEKALQNDLELK